MVGWNFSGKMMPDKYGIAGSTVKFAQAITSGYFNQDITGLAAPSIAPALFFDQDVTLSDGFANESGITTFAQVGMASGKTFTTRGRNNGNETYYKFTVVTNFNGTLNIRGKDHVRIGMVATVGEHVANQAILTITKSANGASAPAVGKVETEDGADASTNAITTSGDDKAVFATINDVSGLYYAVAKIGDSYYATYAAAVEAYTDGDTIEVLDATAGGVPTGWEITSDGTRLTVRTSATDYPVPYSWFLDYGVEAENVEVTATSLATNGVNTWWQCYVLGLDPKGDDTFLTTIRMDGSTPVVEFAPTNETLRASGDIDYVLEGRMSLTNDWSACDSFDLPGDTNRFFRVKVVWQD